MNTQPTLPQNLRVADLIAKTARVTLKDTLRVIAALDGVAFLYDTDPTGIVERTVFDCSRPTPLHVAACEQAFFALNDAENVAALDIAPCLTHVRDLM